MRVKCLVEREYCDGLFFAIFYNDTPCLKVDDSNRQDYVERGADRLRPRMKSNKGKVRISNFNYYEIPVDVIEDPEQLYVWTPRALRVAHRNK